MKQLLTGLSIPQEYVCLGREEFLHQAVVVLTTREARVKIDVTDCNVLLGYRPLIIAISLPCAAFEELPDADICLNFCHEGFQPDSTWRDFVTDRRSVARLAMRRLTSRKLDDHTVVFFEGLAGVHHFIHRFYRFIDRQRRRLRKARPGNVSLNGNLYDQVRIAYSVPRPIALITVGDATKINIFPTDLHGRIGSGYVSSLRSGGRANEQVEGSGKLVISYIASSRYREVYAMGKNHMRDLRPAHEFELLAGGRSQVHGLPLPLGTQYYIELELIESSSAGIHRIHVYRIVHEDRNGQHTTLAHIHQYYAQWRVDHGLPTPILMR